MAHRSFPPSYFNPPRMSPGLTARVIRATLKAPDLEERGVYWARHTKEGCRVLYAVDSTGDVIKHLKLRPSADANAAVAYLWRLLDERDPQGPKVPFLRLG